MDREQFAEQVHDVLTRFHDRGYLQAHPLAGLLLPGPLDGSEGLRLQRLLLDGIREMEPTIGGQPTMPEWRRSRYLYMRYVEALTHEQTVQKLGISHRQGHRDRQEATEELANLLWQRVRRQRPAPETDRSGEGAPEIADQTAEQLLDVSLAKLSQSGTGPTDLAAAVDEVVGTVAELIAAKHARLRVSLAPGLPPVLIGKDALRQALLSAVSYALEVWARGEIELRAASDPPGITLSLVPAANHAGDEESDTAAVVQDPEDGRLLVSRRLLQMHDGRLEVLCQQPQGAIRALRLRLPATRPAVVLIVDDDPDFAQLLQWYLRGHPYRTLLASNASRALQLAREGNPQIIILDVLMPSQDGWDILRRLRQLDQTRNVPVVMCSVLSDRALATSLGADWFLPKPVTQRPLLATLAQCQTALTDRPTRPAGSERTGRS